MPLLKINPIALIFGIVAFSSCKTADSQQNHASIKSGTLSSSSATSCIQTIDANSNHFVKLIVDGNSLTGYSLEIQESSANTNFSSRKFTGVASGAVTDPSKSPKYACHEGGTEIIVWENLAKIAFGTPNCSPPSVCPHSDFSYIALTGEQVTAPVIISCTATNGGIVSKLTFDGTRLNIIQPELQPAFGAPKLILSPIQMDTAPAGEPKYSCNEGMTEIWVWGEEMARINGAFYRINKRP